jgi:hypothetical protein
MVTAGASFGTGGPLDLTSRGISGLQDIMYVFKYLILVSPWDKREPRLLEKNERVPI